ncbi:img2 [Symbiodinium microadriaticum]|nr:img2 [Symbiodinium microadriaticum]
MYCKPLSSGQLLMFRAWSRIFRPLGRAASTTAEVAEKPREAAAERLNRHDRSYRAICPFTVRRTSSDNLPVYVVKRKNRSEDVTIIRKVRGDPQALKRELEFLCRTKVSYGKSGFLQIVGNHRRAIKEYLKSIGY